jgi:hypothetical protein
MRSKPVTCAGEGGLGVRRALVREGGSLFAQQCLKANPDKP